MITNNFHSQSEIASVDRSGKNAAAYSAQMAFVTQKLKERSEAVTLETQALVEFREERELISQELIGKSKQAQIEYEKTKAEAFQTFVQIKTESVDVLQSHIATGMTQISNTNEELKNTSDIIDHQKAEISRLQTTLTNIH